MPSISDQGTDAAYRDYPTQSNRILGTIVEYRTDERAVSEPM